MYFSQSCTRHPAFDFQSFASVHSTTSYPGSVVKESYTWHIPNRQTQVFKLRSSMPNYCTSCNYIIGIYDSGRSEASYQISATTKRHTTQLSQGVAVPSMVTTGNYVYFRFNVANRINGHLNALVQPTGGSAELSCTLDLVPKMHQLPCGTT